MGSSCFTFVNINGTCWFYAFGGPSLKYIFNNMEHVKIYNGVYLLKQRQVVY